MFVPQPRYRWATILGETLTYDGRPLTIGATEYTPPLNGAAIELERFAMVSVTDRTLDVPIAPH